MSDNVIKSTDINSKKDEAEKTPAKKQPAKKAAAKKPKEPKANTDGSVLIVFESGFSYTSNDLVFTREDNMKEVGADQAAILLSLDNFRLPTQEEVDDYFKSKED